MKNPSIHQLRACLCAALFLVSAMAVAAPWRSFTIHRHDASPVQIDISETTSVSFSDQHIVVCDDNIWLEIPFADILYCNHSVSKRNISTGVDGTMQEPMRTMRYENGMLSLSGYGDSSSLTIRSLDGRIVESYSFSSGTVVMLGEFSPGIYVVTADGDSWKIKVN